MPITVFDLENTASHFLKFLVIAHKNLMCSMMLCCLKVTVIGDERNGHQIKFLLFIHLLNYSDCAALSMVRSHYYSLC